MAVSVRIILSRCSGTSGRLASQHANVVSDVAKRIGCDENENLVRCQTGPVRTRSGNINFDSQAQIMCGKTLLVISRPQYGPRP